MYHVRTTFATAGRVLRQLSHDHRTIALLLIVPCVLLSLFRWLFDENVQMFTAIAPAALGVFPFILMFIVTSITTLRERTGGTMERLMVSPIGKLDIILGYMIAFGLVAIVQALLASALLLYGFDLDVAGPNWFLVMVALLDALLGTALGLFVSAFARTEFQAVQFMPALILPQILVCGLIVPLAAMPDELQTFAYYLPLTYAVDALNRVVVEVDMSSEAWRDVWMVGVFIVGAVILGALTLRRRVK